MGGLVDRVVRKNTNNESMLPLTISAQYGLVDQITYFNNRVASRDVSNYYLVLNGEFAYNKSYPFGAVKRLDLYEKGVLSTLYIVFAPRNEQQIDSDFLTVFFDTDRWHKGVAERAAEGARNHGLLNISAEDFFDIDLSVPMILYFSATGNSEYVARRIAVETGDIAVSITDCYKKQITFPPFQED